MIFNSLPVPPVTFKRFSCASDMLTFNSNRKGVVTIKQFSGNVTKWLNINYAMWCFLVKFLETSLDCAGVWYLTELWSQKFQSEKLENRIWDICGRYDSMFVSPSDVRQPFSNIHKNLTKIRPFASSKKFTVRIDFPLSVAVIYHLSTKQMIFQDCG